jgi:hemerythrin superfamily protein
MGQAGRNGLGAAAGAAAVGFIAGVAANKARKVAVQGLEATQGDWFDVLKAEHRLVEGIFEKLLKTDESQKAQRTKLLVALEQALGKHALQEEDVVYPHLRLAGIESETKVLQAEHGDVKTYLHELEVMPKDDPRWIERVREFHKLIDHHVKEEENEIYPRFRARMSSEDNAKLTKRMHLEGLKLA